MNAETHHKTNCVYVFQESTMRSALDELTKVQLDAHPEKKDLIDWVSAAMLDFMHSPQFERRKMILGS